MDQFQSRAITLGNNDRLFCGGEVVGKNTEIGVCCGHLDQAAPAICAQGVEVASDEHLLEFPRALASVVF